MKSIRQKILSVTYLILFIFLFITFFSCKDDIVSPSMSKLDSARYTWTIDTLRAEIQEIWGKDTNNVFLLAPYSLFQSSGNSYREFPLSYGLSSFSMDGLDENNIFIGGGDYTVNYFAPKIGKWNGSQVIDIPVSNPYGKLYYINSVFCINNENILFGTNNRILLKYDGINFQYFTFDSSASIRPLAKDLNNNIFIECFREITNPSHTESYFYIDIYKYDQQSFNKIYTWYSFNNSNNSDSVMRFAGFGGTIYGYMRNKVYKIMNNGLSEILETEFYNRPSTIGGISDVDFMICGEPVSEYFDYYVFNWNGRNISREIYNTGYIFIDIKKIQTTYFCLGHESYPFYHFLFKGREKKGGRN
jgi:hypothetical protein